MILRILLSGLLFRGVFGSHKVVMFKLRLALIAVILCALAVAGRAQQVGITVDTKPTPENIQQWLNSGDARMVSWGAYFARENHDADAIAPMLQLVEAWTPPNDAQDADRRSRTDAMGEVLDALIQQKQPTPLAGLNAIVSSFPRQAMILASRLPLAEATPLLLAWYEKRDSKDDSAIPRIAAMMLAKAPPPGFAASVLAESEVELNVMVESDWTTGHGYGSSSTIDCGDGWGLPSPKGWPPFFDYEIEENSRINHDPVIADAGGDRITYHRFAMNRNWGSCAYPRSLNAATRHRLLAEMLGLTEKEMEWRIQESGTITWENQGQYMSESDSVRPKLSITANDYRNPIGPPLPRLEPRDSRTTITFKQPSD